MRVAVLHDYLNQFGGAERVLQVILEMFPDADLYTLLYDSKKTYGHFDQYIKKTSFLDNPIVRKKHRLFIPFMSFAAGTLCSKERYDLVISSTAGYGKGIPIKAPYHISYCHSPLRYAWEIDYLKDLPFAPWPLKEIIVKPIAKRLQRWDKRAAGRVNLFLANSQFIARKIHSYYGRDAIVVYPPVDTEIFYPEARANAPEYYLMTGRMIYYKRFDLGIQVFNSLRKELKVVGRGPEFEKLKKLAISPFIEFIPYVPDNDLRVLYSNAKAFIFPQVEDFGLVAAEAQACGCPVIAYREGGAEEIVEDGKTGVFFDIQKPEAIQEAIRACEKISWNRNYIAERAQRFSKKEFKKQMKTIIQNTGMVREK